MDRRRFWLSLEIETLVRMRTKPPIKTVKEIAAILGRTEWSVRWKLKDLRVLPYHKRRDPQNWSKLRRGVVSQCKPGRSNAEVAEIVGCSLSFVKKVRRELGIPAGLTSREVSAIAVAYRQAYRRSKSDPSYNLEDDRA